VLVRSREWFQVTALWSRRRVLEALINPEELLRQHPELRNVFPGCILSFDMGRQQVRIV
jgi:hypothetical protein